MHVKNERGANGRLVRINGRFFGHASVHMCDFFGRFESCMIVKQTKTDRLTDGQKRKPHKRQMGMNEVIHSRIKNNDPILVFFWGLWREKTFYMTNEEKNGDLLSKKHKRRSILPVVVF